MLILTRRLGESLIVGNNVELTVLGVKGNQVRIGVNAPKDVSVHRKEIYLRIEAENAENSAKNSVKQIDLLDIAVDHPVEHPIDYETKFIENVEKGVYWQQSPEISTKNTSVTIRKKRRLAITTENNEDDIGNK